MLDQLITHGRVDDRKDPKPNRQKLRVEVSLAEGMTRTDRKFKRGMQHRESKDTGAGNSSWHAKYSNAHRAAHGKEMSCMYVNVTLLN